MTRLRQHTGTVLAKTAPGTDPHRALARVFALTLDTLAPAAPDALGILRALAWLAPVPLPRQVITAPATTEAEDAGAATGDVDDLLGPLASYSLVTLTPATVAVHRLLQACLRDHDRAASGDSQTIPDGMTGGQTTALAWLLEGVPADPVGDVGGWGLWRDLLPHLDTLFDHLPANLHNLDLGQLLNLVGLYLGVQGRHRDALQVQGRALTIAVATLGLHHATTATGMGNLAVTLTRLGRPTEALRLQQRALEISQATHGPDHSEPATRLGNLAATLAELGRPTDALPLEERALAITEATVGPDHPSTALLLGNLAATLAELGRPTDALPLEERALAITEAALGPDHADTAIRLNNLAATLNDLGRAAETLPMQQRALAITEAALGGDHPTTATMLNNLAYTLVALGRHADAAAVRERLRAGAPSADDRSSGPSGP